MEAGLVRAGPLPSADWGKEPGGGGRCSGPVIVLPSSTSCWGAGVPSRCVTGTEMAAALPLYWPGSPLSPPGDATCVLQGTEGSHLCPVPGCAWAGSALEAFACLFLEAGPQSLPRNHSCLPQGSAHVGLGWLCPQGAELGGRLHPVPFLCPSWCWAEPTPSTGL